MPPTRLLFFTRGRGRGHAIPDLVIAGWLRELSPGIQLRFASYSTGAETLAAGGEAVVSLDLVEDAPFLEVMVAAIRTIAAEAPDIVVSHEEFAVLPAARGLGHAPLFIVDFFSQQPTARESLRYAREILFIEHRGIFGEPPEARGKVHYLGPVVRPLRASHADGPAARTRLGLPAEARVIVVIPGAWATEERAPIADLVLPAFKALPHPDKRLVWVAGRDQEQLAQRVGGDPEVMVWKQHSPIEELMVASDLVITKANRGTTIDLARLGVPSVSLSHGLNPIDETLVPRIPSNTALDARGVSPRFLARVLVAALSAAEAGVRFTPNPLYAGCASPAVARRILGLEPA
jgi:hypothetical protein